MTRRSRPYRRREVIYRDNRTNEPYRFEARFTRFVPAEWAQATVDGHLRFGTLSEYRRAERGGEDRLSDSEEGVSEFRSVGPAVQLDGMWNGIHLENVKISGATVANFISRQEVESRVFCATRGDYARGRHLKMLGRNPSLTHFVIFDTRLFADAVGKVCESVLPRAPHAWTIGVAEYVESRTTLDRSLAPRSPDEHREMRNALLRKPARFRHEHEIRFAISAGDDPVPMPILVRDLPPDVALAFAAAVIRSGSWE